RGLQPPHRAPDGRVGPRALAHRRPGPDRRRGRPRLGGLRAGLLALRAAAATERKRPELRDGDGGRHGHAAVADLAEPRMILTLLIFLPVIGAILVGLLPREEHGQLRVAAMAFMVATFALSLWAWVVFEPRGPEFQLDAQYA